MRRLLAILLLLFVTFPAFATGYEIPSDIFIRAWSKAVRAADVEKKYTPGPPLTLWEPALVFEIVCDESGECGTARILGYFQTEVAVKKGGKLCIKERVVILISPTERAMCEGFLEEILIHEFLHYLYLRKIFTDSDFAEQHPDEHAWIDEVYDFKVECWLEESDEEEACDSVDGPDPADRSGRRLTATGPHASE